jgi:hypothetical protein
MFNFNKYQLFSYWQMISNWRLKITCTIFLRKILWWSTWELASHFKLSNSLSNEYYFYESNVQLRWRHWYWVIFCTEHFNSDLRRENSKKRLFFNFEIRQNYDYRIYSRKSRSAYKSNCQFTPNFCPKLETPVIVERALWSIF